MTTDNEQTIMVDEVEPTSLPETEVEKVQGYDENIEPTASEGAPESATEPEAPALEAAPAPKPEAVKPAEPAPTTPDPELMRLQQENERYRQNQLDLESQQRQQRITQEANQYSQTLQTRGVEARLANQIAQRDQQVRIQVEQAAAAIRIVDQEYNNKLVLMVELSAKHSVPIMDLLRFNDGASMKAHAEQYATLSALNKEVTELKAGDASKKAPVQNFDAGTSSTTAPLSNIDRLRELHANGAALTDKQEALLFPDEL